MNDWVNFFEGVRDEYLEHLESEHEVTTAAEYLDHVEADVEDPSAFRVQLQQNEFQLKHLFQCLPVIDQDVVLLSSNPGLKDDMTTDVFEDDGEFGKNRKQTNDLEEQAENLANNLYHYLISSNGFSKIIPRLQDGFSLLTSQDEVPFDKYVRPEENAPGAQNFFSEVYYSRVYKFPSHDEDDLTDEDLSFGKETFSRELDLITSKVVVATGKHAWQGVYEMIPDDEIVPHNDSHLTPKFWKYTRGQARGGVYEISSRELWVITTRHGSYAPDTERLENNIAYVNERI